jgi:hypothetical protein
MEVLAAGMASETALQNLMRIDSLAETGPIEIEISDKDFRAPFDPFLADPSRYSRSPVGGGDFSWILRHGGPYDTDLTELVFQAGRLARIVRIKKN